LALVILRAAQDFEPAIQSFDELGAIKHCNDLELPDMISFEWQFVMPGSVLGLFGHWPTKAKNNLEENREEIEEVDADLC